MHTSRLPTLLFTTLSVFTASHASQTQQDEKYYEVKSYHLHNNIPKHTYLLIQASTPLSKIRQYMQTHNFSNMVVYKSDFKKRTIDAYHLTLSETNALHDTCSLQSLLENHVRCSKTPSEIKRDAYIGLTTNIFHGKIIAQPTQANMTLQGLPTALQTYKPDNLLQRIHGLSCFKDTCVVFTKHPTNHDVDIIQVQSNDDMAQLQRRFPLGQSQPTQPTQPTHNDLNTVNNIDENKDSSPEVFPYVIMVCGLTLLLVLIHQRKTKRSSS